MRLLEATLGALSFTGIVTIAACSSNVATGAGGTVGGTGAGDTGAGSTTTACIAEGDSCETSTLPCCGGTSENQCEEGVCQPCFNEVVYPQCMCGGIAVGKEYDCSLCEGDAGLPDGGDGGACQCVQVTYTFPC